MQLATITCLECGREFNYQGRNPVCCLADQAYDSFISNFSTRAAIKQMLGQKWLEWPGVGQTPLIDLAIGPLTGRRILGKAEHQNPTGSFKDRETEVAVNVARAQGANEVAVISSGNAAVSVAAFCRQIGLACLAYVPEKTSPEKLEPLRASKATVFTRPGFFEDVYISVINEPGERYHVSAGQNPFRELGSAEISREIVAAGGVPDHILAPAGNGLLVWGLYCGFVALRKAGLIDRLPIIHAVQIKGAAPLAAAQKFGQTFVRLEQIEDSIAEGIVALESYCAPKALRALAKTGGDVIEVTDSAIRRWEEILDGEKELDLESTAVAVFPALEQLNSDPAQLVVAILTGSRLKP